MSQNSESWKHSTMGWFALSHFFVGAACYRLGYHQRANENASLQQKVANLQLENKNLEQRMNEMQQKLDSSNNNFQTLVEDLKQRGLIK